MLSCWDSCWFCGEVGRTILGTDICVCCEDLVCLKPLLKLNCTCGICSKSVGLNLFGLLLAGSELRILLSFEA